MVTICTYMHPFSLETDLVYIGDMNLEELLLAIVEILDDESEQSVKEAFTLWNLYVFFALIVCYSLSHCAGNPRKLN